MSHVFAIGTEPRVLHEDESLVALSKPVRMHTAPRPSKDRGGEAGLSLCDWAFARFPELRDASSRASRQDEGGLLHRLDYETSGLVLFARNPEAHAFLLARQEEEGFRKEYRLCVSPAALSEARPLGSRPVRNVPTGLDGALWAAAFRACTLAPAEGNAPAREGGLESLALCLGAAGEGGDYPYIESRFRPYGPGAARVACRASVEKEGVLSRKHRAAITEPYRTELLAAERTGEGLELRVALACGFRHQIRAHLAWVGLPLLGDELYGGLPWPRLCLHACRLSFRHPSGRDLVLED